MQGYLAKLASKKKKSKIHLLLKQCFFSIYEIKVLQLMSRGASMKNLVKGSCFHKKKVIQTMFLKRMDFDDFFFEIQTGLSFYS